MATTSTTTLADGRPIGCVQAATDDAPTDLARALALGTVGPVVVVAGGDDAVADAQGTRLTQLVARGLVRTLREIGSAPAAQAVCLVRASGEGVPSLLARAVADGGGVRLLGVAPQGAVGAADGPAALGGLTHLLVSAGPSWGDELPMKADVAQALAAGTPGLRPMLLLIGGAPGGGALAEVLTAVRRGWSVLLVEGSGGTADALVRQARAGDADDDDPVVAEILADGKLSWVTLGDNKAAVSVEALARLIQRECGGDSVLRQAWRRFGALDAAAVRQQANFGRMQSWILILGVLVVVVSVWRTALHGAGGAPPGTLETWLGYTLVILPICLSTVIAVNDRFLPGKRWLALRSAAEDIKREIYLYRVRPARIDVEGARDKRLAKALETTTLKLVSDDPDAVGVPAYRGEVPPRYAVAAGDDGIGLLSADRYLRLRLEDQLAWYRAKAYRLDRSLHVWVIAAIVISALGSLLEAFKDPWAIWVPVATTLGGAIITYIGQQQFQKGLIAYGRTATALENLQSWWTALPPDEQAADANIQALVLGTERLLSDERAEWAPAMTQAQALKLDAQSAAEGDPKAAPAGEATGPGAAAQPATAAAAGPSPAVDTGDTPAAADAAASDAAPEATDAAPAAPDAEASDPPPVTIQK